METSTIFISGEMYDLLLHKLLNYQNLISQVTLIVKDIRENRINLDSKLSCNNIHVFRFSAEVLHIIFQPELRTIY